MNTNPTNLTNFFLCAAIRVIRAIRVQKTKMMSVQKTKMMSVENNQECFVVLWSVRLVIAGEHARPKVAFTKATGRLKEL